MNNDSHHLDNPYEKHQNDKENVDRMFRQIKAEQLGVHVDDLKQTHVDGKRVFVAKNTTVESPQKRSRQRSIRGQGSVIEDVNRRLTDTEELIKDLESKGLIVGMESYDLLDQLGTIAEKSEAAIHPLMELETDIERRKHSVANYHKYHRSFIEIQKLRQTGDIKAAEELESDQGLEYREFRLVYRAMVPLLNQARELRLSLLREKRRLVNLQYNLMRKFLCWQVNEVSIAISEAPGDPALYEQYREGLKPWKQLPEYRQSVWKPGTPVAKQVSMLESDIVSLSDQVDEALPTASEFINKIYELLINQIERESNEGS